MQTKQPSERTRLIRELGGYGKYYEYISRFPEKRVKAKPRKAQEKIGRNDKCLCGSGKKYKKCCLKKKMAIV